MYSEQRAMELLKEAFTTAGFNFENCEVVLRIDQKYGDRSYLRIKRKGEDALYGDFSEDVVDLAWIARIPRERTSEIENLRIVNLV